MKTLRMTGVQHDLLKQHLLALDGNEAAAILFCEFVERGNNSFFLLKEIKPIPYEGCTIRTAVAVTWPTESYLMPNIEKIEKKGLSVFLAHSHPTGYPSFSPTDDECDYRLLGSLYTCIDESKPHGSIIMFPNGSMKARLMDNANNFTPVDRISVAGNRIQIYESPSDAPTWQEEYQKKTEQVLGKKTLNTFRKLKIGIVGCSGTGSPSIELLMRHSAKELVLIDFDIIKNGNLNRMIMSRAKDAIEGKPKVDRYKEWAEESGLDTKIIALKKNAEDEEAIRELSTCDIIFSCVDNIEAKHFVNQLSCAYLIPLFDLGVGITLDNERLGGITHAIARSHYLQPDKECLLDREAYTANQLAAEGYKRTDPEFYNKQVKAGYLVRVGEDQPAVMVLTVEAAVLAVEDLLARLHGYRLDDDCEFDQQERSITHGYYTHRSYKGENQALKRYIAIGDKLIMKKKT